MHILKPKTIDYDFIHFILMQERLSELIDAKQMQNPKYFSEYNSAINLLLMIHAQPFPF